MTTKTQIQPIPDLSEVQGAALRIDATTTALQSVFLERDDEINCIKVALIARKHVFLLGPPGTAKSMLASFLRTVLGNATYFELLMTRFTKDTEVFGPPSIPALQREEYYHVTKGFLPTAEVAFLDEVFKANSAILNALLTALNEGYYDNGTKGRVPIPLQMCIGASNELPEQNAGLEALFDRFVLRRDVRYIADEDNFRKLLTIKQRQAQNAALLSTLTLDPADIDTLREAAPFVDVSPVEDSLVELWKKLGSEHGIRPSDRMWVNAVDLIQACAVLDGRMTAEGEDLLILADAMWQKPEDRDPIFATVTSIGAPSLAQAHDLLTAAAELFRAADLSARDEAAFGKLAATNRELKVMLKEFDKLPKSSAIAKLRGKVADMQKRCGAAAAGLLD